MRNSNLFKNTFLFLIFFISSRSFSDDCLESVEFAKSFYREHAEFYSADPKYVKSLVTPKLYEILILNSSYTPWQPVIQDISTKLKTKKRKVISMANPDLIKFD